MFRHFEGVGGILLTLFLSDVGLDSISISNRLL